jgi:tetratricopeptide (TPR) repeat protein
VRINVALADAENRLQVWADRFEREEAERLSVQDEIVRGLARRLQVGVVAFTAARRQPRGNPKVGHHLAKGWGIIFGGQRAGTIAGADEHFEAALRLAPDNVSALIGLAAFHISSVTLLLVPEREPWLGQAEKLLLRAIALDPEASPAHYFLGVLRRVRGELEPALVSFARALELNPSLAPAHAQVGHVLNRLGRPDEAIEHIRYAIRLSPNDPLLGIWLTFGGIAELNLGHDEAAADWLGRALATNPRNPLAQMGLAALHALKGDTVASARHVTELRGLVPAHTPDSLYRWFLGPAGETGHEQRFRQGMRQALDVAS